MQLFERNRESNIFMLHEDLMSGRYCHGPYDFFTVFEPKKRQISKGLVRDRLVHHMIYKMLVEELDDRFIAHSFACRKGKGTHKGVQALQKMVRRVSKNGTGPCFFLKMDIKRFFDSVSHPILKLLLAKHVKDGRLLKLIYHIIDSFHYPIYSNSGRGLPLGNVTSQVFANLYMHQLDIFVKHVLKECWYLRFCDDFVLLSRRRGHLKGLIEPIKELLAKRLELDIHPKKVILRKALQGCDFLGYVVFYHHTLLRGTTKKRMKQRLEVGYGACLEGKESFRAFYQTLQSYLGILSHANQYTLSTALRNHYPVAIPKKTTCLSFTILVGGA